jgi:hypothetical protein
MLSHEQDNRRARCNAHVKMLITLCRDSPPLLMLFYCLWSAPPEEVRHELALSQFAKTVRATFPALKEQL